MKANRAKILEEAEKQKKISQLRTGINSEELKLQDDAKRREGLTRDLAQRTSKLTSAKFALNLKKGTATKEIRQMQESHTRRMMELNAKIESLTKKKQELERNIQAIGILEYETERLHDRLDALQNEYYEQEQKNMSELEELRKESFNTQMQLEHTNRQTLKELEVQYEQRAFEEMKAESLNALQENERLQIDLSSQSRLVVNLIEDQKKTFKSLNKHRIERDILEASKTLEDKQLTKLKTMQKVQEDELEQMRACILRLHKNVKAKKDALEFSQTADYNLRLLQQKQQKLKQDEVSMKARTLTLIKKELKLIHSVRLRQMTKDFSLPLLKLLDSKQGESNKSSLSSTTTNITFHHAKLPINTHILGIGSKNPLVQSDGFSVDTNDYSCIWNANYQKGGVLSIY